MRDTRTMQRFARLALAAVIAFAATTCHAAPASRESVEALFALMNMDRTLADSLDKMQALTKQSLASLPQARSLSPEQRVRFDAGMARVDATLREAMTWSKLEPVFVQIYSETFTQDEIDGQLAFYRTAAGQAVIAKTPLLTQRSMTAMQAQLQTLLPSIQETMQSAMKPAAAASAP